MRGSALVLAVFMAGCGNVQEAAAPLPVSETERTISTGSVVGLRAANDALVWRAIPYAAPPVGSLRWRAPRAVEAWSEPRNATQSGPPCPQVTNNLDHRGEVEPGRLIGSEDCLTLDVYAPATSGGEDPLPVMIWIHGGGNAAGSSAAFDGSRLAQNQRVLVVIPQYRLGPLGWFAHPALRESAKTEEDKAASFGLLDIIAALRWVQANAASFGGDPSRVTLVGQSAGAHNIAALLTSPRGRGLFHRAVIQSGGFGASSIAESEDPAHGAPNPSRAIAEELGVKTAEALRAVSLEALFSAYDLDRFGILRLPSPIADGVAVPVDGTDVESVAVPVIVGVTRDETRLVQFYDPNFTDGAASAAARAIDPDLYEANAEYISRLRRLMNVDRPVRRIAEAGGEVFAYRFDWDEGGRNHETDFAFLLGAAHGVDIPFVFDRFQLFEGLDRYLFAEESEEGRRALAAVIGAYWAEFARRGAPGDGGAGLARWPRWRPGAPSVMRLDSPASGGPEPIVDEETIGRIFADLKEDRRLDDEARCRIGAAILARDADAADAFLDLGCASP